MAERAFCYGGHRFKMIVEPEYGAAIERLKADGMSDEQAARHIDKQERKEANDG